MLKEKLHKLSFFNLIRPGVYLWCDYGRSIEDILKVIQGDWPDLYVSHKDEVIAMVEEAWLSFDVRVIPLPNLT